MRQVEPPLAVIIIPATRQKNVRQKNGNFIFLSHIFLSSRSGVAETMIKAADFVRKAKAFVLGLATNQLQNPLAPGVFKHSLPDCSKNKPHSRLDSSAR